MPLRQDGKRIRTDLICSIAICRNPICSYNYGAHLSLLHHVPRSAVCYEDDVNVLPEELPARQPCPLEQRPCFINKDTHDFVLSGRCCDDALCGSFSRGRKCTGVAMGENG